MSLFQGVPKGLFLVRFILVTCFFSSVFSQDSLDDQKVGGWKLINYTFVDGTSHVERVLAGTSSMMDDVEKYRGKKGNIEISKNRWDKKTGALLAGVTYVVKWTDPPPALFPGEQIRMQYEIQIITSKSWTPDNQSVNFNQGMGGVFLLNSKGENYFKTDFKSELISSKTVVKGSKNHEEKTITVNFGAGFKAIYTYEYDVNLKRGPRTEQDVLKPEPTNQTGWYLTNYTFVDGTSNIERVLAGTNSKMNDVEKFKGGKGNIEISKNRWDKKTGALLAGVTYVVKLTDPPRALFPGEKIRMQYEIKIITSKSWTPDNQSVNFNQGMGGVFLLNSKGENYFKTNFKTVLISSKTVGKGYKNREEKTLTANLGSGFKAIYTYEWREF